MSAAPLNISNPLHRSGAIDYNVSFAVRTADIQRRSDNKIHPDELSVREREPLFVPLQGKERRGHLDAPDAARNPTMCLSGLNGMKWSRSGAVRTQGETDDDLIRRIARQHILPCGLAVTGWDFGQAGKQQDQFVAAMGGGNSVYCDTDCRAGDLLWLDIPLCCAETILRSSGEQTSEAEARDLKFCARQNPKGFVEWHPKRGVPPSKRTLVVRSLPRDSPAHELPSSWILGRATSNAKAGERVDLVMGAGVGGLCSS